jgi:hypothetical protein
MGRGGIVCSLKRAAAAVDVRSVCEQLAAFFQACGILLLYSADAMSAFGVCDM